MTQNVNDLVSLQDNAPARILIVDDEDQIRFALTRILRLEGYIADEASSGAEALNLLVENSYDLMVLDMRMRGMHGLEVMQRVRKTHPELLVIILTGQATLESAIAATRAENVVDYLLKPAGNDEFVRAVARALKKRVEHLRRQSLVNAATQMLNAMHQPELVPDPANVSETSPPPAPPSSPTETERFIHVPPLTLDRHKRLITVTDDPTRVIELTKGEAAILTCLMLNPNQVLSCYELVTNALDYEINEAEAEGLIRPYIFRLRRKIEPNPKKPCLICTVRRQGYRFMPSKM